MSTAADENSQVYARAMTVALATLGGIAILGFVAPALGSGTSIWNLWIPQMLVMLIGTFITGRMTGLAGVILGGVVGLLGLLAAMYGSYAAHALGLWGLETSDFGSDDSPGQDAIAVGLLVFGLPVLFLGALAGLGGALTSPRGRL